MKDEKRSRLIHTPQLEDVPELIHHIQSKLPLKEAARTCVLSKSWLHAWSTIPTLRFSLSSKFVSKEQKEKQLKVVDRTLNRYFGDNIPIEKFNLEIDIVNQESASLAEKLIRPIASKSCIKELSLIICSGFYFFTLPDEIFSSGNLITISIKTYPLIIPCRISISSNLGINCLSLRVLELCNVCISVEVLDNLLSTCNLLEKINFCYPKGAETIKVKNLRFLKELEITSRETNSKLEISDVPSLSFLMYDYSTFNLCQIIPLPFNMDSLRHVTQLHIGGLIIENAFFDLIKSKFPFLESLTLEMKVWGEESMDITCASLKKLTLISEDPQLINLQVHATKLLFFCYVARPLPSLLFPTISPEKLEISFKLLNPFMDNLFFHKLREILNLSSKFDIEIVTSDRRVAFNIDDLKQRLSLPAMSIRKLSLKNYRDKGLRKHSPILDAMFLICYPKYVKAYRDTDDKSRNYFSMLMIREMMERVNRKGCWSDLKDIEIKNPCDGRWETPTSSWTRFLDESTPVDRYPVEFKLNWCSP